MLDPAMAPEDAMALQEDLCTFIWDWGGVFPPLKDALTLFGERCFTRSENGTLIGSWQLPSGHFITDSDAVHHCR
jgi:hypothetical protein